MKLWDVSYTENGQRKRSKFLPKHFFSETNEGQVVLAHAAAVDFKKNLDPAGIMKRKKKQIVKKKCVCQLCSQKMQSCIRGFQ